MLLSSCIPQDSFSALKLILVLHKVVQDGASVLLTIHQPASDILEKIDRLVLLRAGRCMYNGPEDSVTDYFAARTHPLPPKYNPADWIMIVAQTVPENELEELGYFPDGPSDEEEAIQKQKGKDTVMSSHNSTTVVEFRHVSIFTQVSCLVRREMLSIRRNKMVLGARLMLTVFMSVLISVIFLRVGGKNQEDPVVRHCFAACIGVGVTTGR